MKYPKISVITVTYNAADALRRTLESVVRADYPNLEAIVIDGASADDTPAVLREFASIVAYSVSEPDDGIYDAMNKGLKAATGEYVWFVNAGDTIYDSEVIRFVFEGEEEPADIYYGETLIRSEEGKIMGLRKKKLPARMTWKSFFRGMVVCHQSILVRREIAPFYDTGYRYAADVEWVLLALKRARTIVNTHCVLTEFVEGGASDRHRREALKERFRIMRKYFGLLPTVAAHGLFVLDAFRPRYRKLRRRKQETL